MGTPMPATKCHLGTVTKHFSSVSGAGPRASFYNGSIGRSLTTTDRSSERTDKIIRKEINDAIRAVENRSEAINVGKMMKIHLARIHRR
jgi:hypothetical protein